MEQESYARKVAQWHVLLQIPTNYAVQSGLPLYEEPDELQPTELDYMGREQRLTPAALTAWIRMRDDAAGQGVALLLVSAFRSVEYQAQLIQRKLDRGLLIDDILTVNAAPGHSEHHTGRAIDIGTIDCPVLEEEFEATPAFAWLLKHAGEFGFKLSYPRNNDCGICYEPWHWCFSA